MAADAEGIFALQTCFRCFARALHQEITLTMLKHHIGNNLFVSGIHFHIGTWMKFFVRLNEREIGIDINLLQSMPCRRLLKNKISFNDENMFRGCLGYRLGG